jgi:ketosteroid isomerase-like protein
LKVAGTKSRLQIDRLLQGLSKFVPQPMQMTIVGTTAEANRVAVETECLGTWRNGVTYHNRYHFLFEIRDGLVSKIREYMDTKHLFDVLAQDPALSGGGPK